jgi:hypothetical protein
MTQTKAQKSGSWTPQIQKKAPSLAPPPIVVQRDAVAAPTSEAPLPEYTPLEPNALQNHPLMGNISDLPPIQTKLTIGAPGDRYEQEADTIARKVVSQINSPTAQAKPATKVLQRQPVGRDITVSPFAGMMQAKEAIAGGPASQDLESSINRAKGGGQPLDAGLQQSMGQAMGADFSGVRVHTDANSHQLNQSIQAKAFTTGQDVFFAQGQYNPGSKGGQELIAHELTHVVQQNGNVALKRVQPKLQRKSNYDVLQRQKSHILQTKGNDAIVTQPKTQGQVSGVVQRGIWASIKSAAQAVGSAIVTYGGKLIGGIVNIGAWVGKALLKGITGGFKSLFRIFSLPRLLEDNADQIESLKDITENLNRAKQTGSGWVKFASSLNVLSIVVGDISTIAGTIGLISGLIGLIPGAQPALAVSGTAAMIAMIATGVKTAIDLAITAILKWGNLNGEDHQEFYANKKKDLAADVIGLAIGGAAGGLASMAGGSSAGEAFKGAYLPGDPATEGIAGLIENSVGAFTGASAGGITETISGTEADENATEVSGTKVGEYEGKDFKARLAQDASDKLEMITDPLTRIKKTWEQIKKVFSDIAQAFKDFWEGVSKLFSKAIRGAKSAFGLQPKPNDSTGGQEDSLDRQMEKEINPETAEQAEEQGKGAIKAIKQGADGMAKGLGGVITAIEAKQKLLKKSASAR